MLTDSLYTTTHANQPNTLPPHLSTVWFNADRRSLKAHIRSCPSCYRELHRLIEEQKRSNRIFSLHPKEIMKNLVVGTAFWAGVDVVNSFLKRWC